MKSKKNLNLLADADGNQTPAAVNMNDRELETLHTLIAFSAKNKIKSSSKNKDEAPSFVMVDSDYSTGSNNANYTSLSNSAGGGGGNKNDLQIELPVINENGGGSSGEVQILKGVKKRKKNAKGVGLIATLKDENSALPQQLSTAIHASVFDTVTKDERDKELTDREKIDRIIDELFRKVDSYWDENIILFPKRSPTIFAGYAHKLTKKEKEDMQSRIQNIEMQEIELSENYSDSYDSDDAFEMEQKWPKPSRKYGQDEILKKFYDSLKDIEADELLKLWDYFDKEKTKKIDYKETLVKLLASLFLLYYRRSHSTTNILHENKPPKFTEIEPLLKILAKYIRDNLRKQKKKFLAKKDYKTLFIKNYLKNAIEKRSKLLKNRHKKIFGYNEADSQSEPEPDADMNMNDELTPAPQKHKIVDSTDVDDIWDAAFNDVAAVHANNNDVIEEEEEVIDDDEKEPLNSNRPKKQRQSSKFRDGVEAQKELKEMFKNYTPRESSNKFLLNERFRKSTDDAGDDSNKIVMKIDVDKKKKMRNSKNIKVITPHSHTPQFKSDEIDIDDIDIEEYLNENEEKEKEKEKITTESTQLQHADSSALDIHTLLNSMHSEENIDDEKKEHVKDNDGTTVLNEEIEELKPKKVVVLNTKNIQNNHDSLELDDNLMDLAINMVNTQSEDANLNLNHHQQNDTEVQLTPNADDDDHDDDDDFNAQIEDVLDVTFAIDDDSDDE